METQVITTVDEVLGRVAELEPMIRAASAEAEIERRLSAHVAEALRGGGATTCSGRVAGGLELDPVSAFRVIEELSRIDSAAGWNVALPTPANLSEPGFRTRRPRRSSAPPDRHGWRRLPAAAGRSGPGGYRLSGRCAFNSNCHAATWIVGLAHVYDDGVSVSTRTASRSP